MRSAFALLAAPLLVAGVPAPWVWPLTPRPAVTRPFDGPPVPWSPGHRGVDLTANVGQAVLAPDAGVVVFAGTVVDRHVITVQHPDGLRSSFEPVSGELPVGTAVTRGQRIAAVATGTHCPAVCLHWGVRRDEQYLNPLLFVPRRHAVLLPDPTG